MDIKTEDDYRSGISAEHFGDPNSKEKTFTDESGNITRAEILYGGKSGGVSEGHGHWVAENIDGLMQVVLDRRPDSVGGGKHFIDSRHPTDAYSGAARLDNIRAKEAIINELRFLDPSSTSLGKRVKELRDKLFNCGSCGHDDNKRLKQEFNEVADNLFRERERIWDGYKSQKESLVSRAENLAYSTDYREAKSQMKSLMEEWKKVPRASKESDDQLWNRFKRASDRLYENAERDYQERKRKQEGAKQTKENLIRQAENLANSTDFKSAKAQLNSLRDQWKNAPRAAKNDEDALWNRFKAASDRIYDNAKRDYEQRQSQQQAAKAKKVHIISQIESLAYASDLGSAASEVKRLTDEFYNAGSAGQDNQILKERLNAAKNRFYSAKKQQAEQKHRDYLNRLRERISRKQDALRSIEAAIDRKNNQLNEMRYRSQPNFTNPHYWDIIARRNERESRLNGDIRDLQMKRSSIINEIAELQSKLSG